MLKLTIPPVLLVKQETSELYRHAVVGVDFSMFSRAAIRQAQSIARGTEVASEIAYEQRLKIDDFLSEEMDRLGKKAEKLGLRPGSLETTLKEGEPRHVLRSECARVGADLLVIGTHSRPGLSRAIWGSVAADFLNAPPCDVLVIRPY